MSREFTEEELRALEAEMERLTPDDVLLQTLVTLINLGARKAGLTRPPEEQSPERDLEQTRQSIEGARAILPLVEARHAEQLAPVRQALSQLQMAFVQLSGGPAPDAAPAGAGEASPPPGEEPKPQEGPGQAQRSGRLWIPGQ